MTVYVPGRSTRSTDIYGNREFIEHLRNRGKFFDHDEKRERDLILIDYEDPARNVYEVTEEFAFHNGHYGTREDVVFLINGIPVLVIECKNANKDEELNKILERAVNLKNFLKGKERIQKVAQFVAEHYRENVEPLGYKAFLVGVDREACAHYKHALDQLLD